MRLPELAKGRSAVIQQVQDVQQGDPNATDPHAVDPIARRLRDLGFVPGEPVRIVAHGPLGADPLLVQIGYTRFALRRSEAERVVVAPAT